jgi:hypothetical protein
MLRNFVFFLNTLSLFCCIIEEDSMFRICCNLELQAMQPAIDFQQSVKKFPVDKSL